MEHFLNTSVLQTVSDQWVAKFSPILCVIKDSSFKMATTVQCDAREHNSTPTPLSLHCCSVKLSAAAISFTAWLRAGGERGRFGFVMSGDGNE